MKREEQQYYSFKDVVNTALSKVSKLSDTTEAANEKEMSMNIISDLTYINIWNAFTKWCQDMTELNYVIDIPQFCEMFYFADKPLDGIIIKLSKSFLSENHLNWDIENSNYEKNYKSKYLGNTPKIQKLNCNSIAKELNMKNAIIQNGLTNLFQSIGQILSTNPNCLIDLGVFGNLYINEKNVIQYPSKCKGTSQTIRKTTIKSLIDRRNNLEEIYDYDYEVTNEKQNVQTSNEFNNSETLHSKENININSKKQNIDIKLKPKVKLNFNFKNVNKGQEIYNYKRKRQDESKVPIEIPMLKSNWKMKEMLNATFKIIHRQKAKSNPILFNAYSNTKAAPFTSEKTQIPLSHRIGSFYTLSMQDFIIDKTTKNIKRLFDDYFYRYQGKVFDEPATEMEEYMHYVDPSSVDQQKIEMKKIAYKRYYHFIEKSIPNSYISEMKPEWLYEITCKAKAFTHQKNENGDIVQNNFDESNKFKIDECFTELQNEYEDSMKRAILDYILKHPEQRKN